MSGPGPIGDMAAWTAEKMERIDGRPVVCSVSGGKDSTAMVLLLKEAGIPYQLVHMDTGWEHELTEEYVRGYLPGVLGPIKVLQGKHGGMEDLVRKKGMFPSRVRRFCTQELKVFPMKRHLAELMEEGHDPLNVVGIRAGESQARSKMPEWEEFRGLDVEVWRPILTWSYQDVIDMHHRHGVKPNPLYLMGATRVGCWPCIFARKDEIRMIADLDPGRIDRLRALESDVGDAAAARANSKGKELDGAPSWFQTPHGRSQGVGTAIDEVVKWSRTARGGKHLELFAPPYAEEGCMRWGMCDTVSPEQEAK